MVEKFLRCAHEQYEAILENLALLIQTGNDAPYTGNGSAVADFSFVGLKVIIVFSTSYAMRNSSSSSILVKVVKF